MGLYTLGVYEKAFPGELGFEERLSAAKQCGFDFMELSIDATDEKLERLDWTDSKIDALHQLSVKVGLPVATMCMSGVRRFPIGSDQKKTAEHGLEIVQKAVDFSAKLGIRIVQVGGFDVKDGEVSTHSSRGRFLFNLRACTAYAAQKGVMLGIETMENDFVNTVEKAMYYVNEINSPYLTVYPDTGNISNGTEDIVKDILCGKGHICAAHLKETRPGVFRDLNYGEGRVDFDLAVRTYRSVNVNMFNAEFWYDGSINWLKRAQDAHDFLALKLDASEKFISI